MSSLFRCMSILLVVAPAAVLAAEDIDLSGHVLGEHRLLEGAKVELRELHRTATVDAMASIGFTMSRPVPTRWSLRLAARRPVNIR